MSKIFKTALTLLTLFSAAVPATLAQQSEKTEMLYRRGLAAYQAKDYASAESFFTQTLETGYSPEAAVYLTYIRKETGDFAGALESLQSYLDNTGENDPELQSYISLKLFLEARIASGENESRLKTYRSLALVSLVLAVLALGVSILSLRKK